MNSTEPTHVREMKVVRPDSGNQHCEFNEDVNSKFPEQLIEKIGMTIFADSNSGHEKVTGKSVTGLASLLGSTPENWFAKRNSSCLTSAFGVDFTNSKNAVEDAIVIRNYCRSFEMRVSRSTVIHEDSMLVVTNSTNPGSNLQHESI